MTCSKKGVGPCPCEGQHWQQIGAEAIKHILIIHSSASFLIMFITLWQPFHSWHWPPRWRSRGQSRQDGRPHGKNSPHAPTRPPLGSCWTRPSTGRWASSFPKQSHLDAPLCPWWIQRTLEPWSQLSRMLRGRYWGASPRTSQSTSRASWCASPPTLIAIVLIVSL